MCFERRPEEGKGAAGNIYLYVRGTHVLIFLCVSVYIYTIYVILFFSALRVMLRCYQKCIFIFRPCPGLGRNLVNNLNIRIQRYSWEFFFRVRYYSTSWRVGVRSVLLPTGVPLYVSTWYVFLRNGYVPARVDYTGTRELSHRMPSEY